MSIFKVGNVLEWYNPETHVKFQLEVLSEPGNNGRFRGKVLKNLSKEQVWEVGLISYEWQSELAYWSLHSLASRQFTPVPRQVPNLFQLEALCEREASLLAEYESVKSERQALELELETWLEVIKNV